MNEKSGLSSISAFLNDREGPLAGLSTHAAGISDLQKKLCSYLPGDLSEHVTVANFSSKSLCLHADSAAWATRLRFKIPELLHIVRNQCGLTSMQTIRIKVTPSQTRNTTLDNRPVLSEKTAHLLQDIGESTTDPELRDALLRLSRHSRP